MTAQCAPYMSALKIFRSPCWLCVQNLKFVASHVPEKIGGSPKNWTVPGYAHTPFSPKFLMDFCSNVPFKPAKFEVCSFTHSWDNRGYLKTLGSPQIRPCSLFYKIFNGLLFGCTLWMPTLKSVAWPVPELIAIDVLGGGCEPPNLGEEEVVTGRGWYRSKERWWVPIGPPW